MAAIWVFAEYSNGAMDKVTYEAVSEARRLADAQGAPVAAVVFGSGVDEAAPYCPNAASAASSTPLPNTTAATGAP